MHQDRDKDDEANPSMSSAPKPGNQDPLTNKGGKCDKNLLVPKLRRPTQPILIHQRPNATSQPPRSGCASWTRVTQPRIPTGEAGAVAEGELHAGLLHIADLAAVFKGCCERLFFTGEVVPVEAGGL